MYGKPVESKREVATVFLDLPREIKSVTNPQGNDPPVRIFGPLEEDEEPTNGPERTPVDVDLDGNVAEFTLGEPLGPGRYWVAVYQSRFEAENREPYDLIDEETASPFTGWELQVLNASPRHKADRRDQETKVVESGGPRLKEVLVDGEAAPQVQISGETLTVVTDEPADVSMVLRPLLGNARKSLYEQFATQTEHKVGGDPAVTFSSIGPIQNYKWAVFNGTNTTGRLPLDGQGRLAWATPVLREPTTARLDPLIGGSPETINGNLEEEVDLQPNPAGKIPSMMAYGFSNLNDDYEGPVVKARKGDGVHTPVERKKFTVTEIKEGDLADWADQRVYAEALYNQSPQVKTVTDVFDIDVTLNTAPTSAANSITLTSTESVTITGSEFDIQDDESAPDEITVTLDTVPSYGDLELDGTTLSVDDTFTKQDIQDDLLTYNHDGSGDGADDSFEYTLTDHEGAERTGEQFDFLISYPPITSDDTYTVSRNASLGVNSPGVLSNDSDPEGDTLTVSTVRGPYNGALTLDNDGAFTYVPDTDFSGEDHFVYEVSDGTETVEATATIDVDGDPGVTTNGPLSLNEGSSSTTVGQSLLEATDDVDGPSNLTYTIDAVPTHGTLRLAGTTLNASDTFTQADVNNDDLSYSHDGSETTTDSFDATLSDTDSNQTNLTFPIVVNPVNDAPTISTNTGVTLDEGADETINQAELETTDPESPADNLQYKITTMPTLGALMVDGSPLTSNGTFTQQDINDGLVEYTHDGDEPSGGGPHDSFDFKVTDQSGDGKSRTGSFDITVNALNDAPTITRIPDQHITQSEVLEYIWFTIGDEETNATSLTVSASSGNTAVIPDSNITMITAGTTDYGLRIEPTDYKHSGVPITVSVSDGTNTTQETFTVFVHQVTSPSFARGMSYTIFEDSTLEIDAPGVMSNDAGTSAQNYFVDTDPIREPEHGTLTLNRDGSFEYTPDAEFHGTDYFIYESEDWEGDRDRARVDITVNSVNDAPILLTNDDLVINTGTEEVIGSNLLDSEDVENDATNLTYEVTQTTSNGILRRDGSLLGMGDTFTQKDVDDGLVTYEHTSSGETENDSFGFELSDDGTEAPPAEQLDMELQPTIENLGTNPVLVARGNRFLEANMPTAVGDYTTIVDGGVEPDGGRQPSLFDIGDADEREIYGLDEEGRWIYRDVDHYDDPIPYSSPDNEGEQLHVLRRERQTLESQLAGEDETTASMDRFVGSRDELLLGRSADSDAGTARINDFLLWPRRLTNDEKDSLVKTPRNVYTQYKPRVTPQYADAAIDQYHGRPGVWPKNIVSEANTPTSNPRIFEDAVYFDEEKDTDWSPLDLCWAVFDFPLQHEIAIEVNGREVWSAQTRLLPTLVTLERVKRELDWEIHNPKQALQQIWQASMEALRLWGCQLPTTGPNSVMQEFVLTYLADPPTRSSGTQGNTRSRLGEQSVSARSDRKSERRLAELADLLDDCESQAPLFPEHNTPGDSAGVGETAAEEYYKPKSRDQLAELVAPTSQPYHWHERPRYRGEFHRLDL